jgi:hypothetical protein
MVHRSVHYSGDGKQIDRCIEGRVRGGSADAQRISWNGD